MVASSNAKTNTGSMKNSDKNGVSNPLDTAIVSIKSQNDIVSSSIFSPGFEITSNAFQPTWVEKFPVTSPGARQHSAMAYDSLNDKVIIFGGANGTILGDTWAYDYSSNSWENMNPLVSPVPQQGHAMVYDPSIQKVVLFGSGGQTWTYQYNTNTWEQQTPQVSPSSRLYFSLVYDTTRQKVIMIGGTSSTFETWEMDSTTYNWTNLDPVTPIPRLFAMAASYDQANDKIIVFCEYIKTANNLKMKLKSLDINCVVYHSKLKKDIKNKYLKQYSLGDCNIMIAVKALDEGINVPKTNIGIVIGGSSVKRQIMQRLGRILRKKESIAILYQLYIKNTKDEEYLNKRNACIIKQATEVMLY